MVRAYTRRDYIRKTPNSRIVQYELKNLLKLDTIL